MEDCLLVASVPRGKNLVLACALSGLDPLGHEDGVHQAAEGVDARTVKERNVLDLDAGSKMSVLLVDDRHVRPEGELGALVLERLRRSGAESERGVKLQSLTAARRGLVVAVDNADLLAHLINYVEGRVLVVEKGVEAPQNLVGELGPLAGSLVAHGVLFGLGGVFGELDLAPLPVGRIDANAVPDDPDGLLRELCTDSVDDGNYFLFDLLKCDGVEHQELVGVDMSATLGEVASARPFAIEENGDAALLLDRTEEAVS